MHIRSRTGAVRLAALLAAVALPLSLGAQAPTGQAAPPASPPATPPATTPAAAQPAGKPAAAARPAAPTATPTSRASWLSDRREFAVGDVITVFVDDYTIASAIKDNIASDRRRRDARVGISKPGPAAGAVNAGFETRNDGDSQQRGAARRENRFQSEMSVRVVGIGPNGTLQVKGRKLIDVDKGQQDITITGWVRAQDVSTANVIESSRIADAQVTYLSPGPLGKPKGGIISKIVGIVWP
jgi:flagellar L-ring protein precursor FlgH